ncbi:MAG TPA: SGNH/GDSL hydrolase family protein [Phycisphaerae bacterium]|nr:SGNH/GDSL hydrolase family protein [Phycisphaerae bacterium]
MRSRPCQTAAAPQASTAALAPSRRRLFRLVAVATGTILALAVGEMVVRVFHLGPDIYPLCEQVYTLSDNPRLLFELVPGAVNLKAGLSINADGMRDRDYKVKKPPNTYRIACLGDSICFGWSLEEGEAFPKRLEELLNRYFAGPDRRFEVLNFGVAGYDIAQIVENLRVRALKYEPDLILYGYCLNDPQQFSFTYETLRAQLTAAEKGFRDRLFGPARRLMQRSRLYVLGRYSLESMTPEGRELRIRQPQREWLVRRKEDPIAWVADLYRGDSWQDALNELTSLARITRSAGISTHVVLFPFFKTLDTYPLVEVHGHVAGASRRLSLGVIDLLDDYRALRRADPEPFSLDMTHPNPRGNTFAAVGMLHDLAARGAIPVSADEFARLTSEPDPIGGFARIVSAASDPPATDGSSEDRVTPGYWPSSRTVATTGK